MVFFIETFFMRYLIGLKVYRDGYHDPISILSKKKIHLNYINNIAIRIKYSNQKWIEDSDYIIYFIPIETVIQKPTYKGHKWSCKIG